MIYLDYNATTPLDPKVLHAISDALEYAWGNPSSSHATGVKAKCLMDDARQSVAELVGGIAENIIFTSGGTEANNMVLHSAVHQYRLSRGLDGSITDGSLPHFITSNIEHDSVRKVLEHFQASRIADVTFVPVNLQSGCLEVNDIISAVRPNTCMVSIMMANNETGVIQPVAEISKAVRALRRKPSQLPRILLHTDAAQTIGKVPVSAQDLDVDFMTIVGQKFYGPRIGALYARKPNQVSPMFYGGGQERNYRPGTENTGMIAGLGMAAKLVQENLPVYQQHMTQMRNLLETLLQEAFSGKVHFNGSRKDTSRLPNTCSVSFRFQTRLTGSHILAKCTRVQASVGAACHSTSGSRCSAVLLASGVSVEDATSAVRLSVGRTTTKSDITEAVDDLKQAVALALQELDSSNNSI